MRLLKIVLTALIAACAVLVGLFLAAVAAISSVVFFFFRRAQARPGLGRTVPMTHPATARPTKKGDSEVIDVTATEVPADPEIR